MNSLTTGEKVECMIGCILGDQWHTKCKGINDTQCNVALYTPETGYAIVVARRNLSNATKRLNRNKVALHNLAETIKTAGGDILPYTTRICAIQRDIDSARQAVYRWECKLLSLGIDVHLETLNSIPLKVD